MKYAFLLSLVCALVLGGSPTRSADDNADKQAEHETVTVAMKSLGYDPKKLEIHVGDSVDWTNKAFTTHTATSYDDGKTFDTGDVARGQSSMPVKFEQEGEFKYYCKVHGKAMSGTIVVKAAEK